SVAGEVALRDEVTVRWLDGEHVRRAALEHHGDDATRAAADLRHPSPRKVGRGEERRHDVGEQLRRAVKPVAVAVVGPLLAEISDGAILDRAGGAGDRHHRALVPTVTYWPPTGSGRGNRSSRHRGLMLGGKKRMKSVRHSAAPACRSSREQSAAGSSTALASIGARATIQRVIGFWGLCSKTTTAPPGRTTRSSSRAIPGCSEAVTWCRTQTAVARSNAPSANGSDPGATPWSSGGG